MYLRFSRRLKDGKEHCYWSIVESKRCAGGKIVQRPVLYLGEINDGQREAWCRVIETLDEEDQKYRQLALFPADRDVPEHATGYGVQVRLDAMELHRPWFEQSAMGDLLGEDYSLVQKDALYRCLDKLLPHKEDLFSHLRQRWQDLFSANFDILLYDLTSTYFESDPPDNDEDKRRFGYSRDKRNDCVQVVIGLVVTPDGFPLAYEVLPGNTRDNTTLRSFLQKIEARYGKASRVWVMDRGIPTEETLSEMRQADPPVTYLVGTPKGRLTKLEKDLLKLPWQAVRQGVDVKLLKRDEELYVLAQSHHRVLKERAIRRRKLKWLWARLKEISAMELSRDELLMKLGAARSKAPAAWRLVDVEVAAEGATFSYTLNCKKLKNVRRREGRYLLRTNLCGKDPAELWQ